MPRFCSVSSRPAAERYFRTSANCGSTAPFEDTAPSALCAALWYVSVHVFETLFDFPIECSIDFKPRTHCSGCAVCLRTYSFVLPASTRLLADVGEKAEKKGRLTTEVNESKRKESKVIGSAPNTFPSERAGGDRCAWQFKALGFCMHCSSPSCSSYLAWERGSPDSPHTRPS